MHPLRVVVALALVVLACATVGQAVDRKNFKTCEDAAFCRRHRRKTDFAGKFYVQPATVQATQSGLTAELSGGEEGAPPFSFELVCLTSGTARVRVTEKTSQDPRYESPDILLADNMEAAAVSTGHRPPGTTPAAAGAASYVSYKTDGGDDMVVVVQYTPFKVSQYINGILTTSINNRGLFHFEHRRTRAGDAVGDTESEENPNAGKKIVDWGEDGKPIYEDGSTGGEEAVAEEAPAKPAAGVDDSDTNGMWQESFQTHKDSKPNGPTAISLDITFHGAKHVYGLPEHATSLALKPTDGSPDAYPQPYRMYNLDVFEYELDEPMALYASIPVMLSHDTAKTAGAFWNNPSEMFIDVTKNAEGTHTHWITESGVVDVMLMPGPTPSKVLSQYTKLTGTQALPPMFALGYHQCRWNYKNEADVAQVDAKFEEHNFPYDVLWLDIEHTDGKAYFTWDKTEFPNPSAMQEKLAARGRKMVAIVDPHIKRDGGYPVHTEATAKGYYIKNKDGGDFSGWCWPGDSSYLDFTSPVVRDWWADRFSLENWQGSTKNLFVWNDMNEPSVFNGPEVSMAKDAKSLAGHEHREWHNLYGFYHQMATAEGIRRRNEARPFVLTRSAFAGSQRYGALWTGDNKADWAHLKASAPMIMSFGLTGFSFIGADIGGFFHDPSTELLTRWYQAGAFQPFARAHAHIDTKRREPWLFGDDVLARVRSAIVRRYTYLPYFYTLFHHASVNGAPVMRPLWYEYPKDEATFAMDDQWLLGSDLLIKPVTQAGVTSVDVYFPGVTKWYDTETAAVIQGPTRQTVAAPLDTLPVFQRGGSIIPRKMRLRRCSALMRNDPYTLDVALDGSKQASGSLYVDDEESFGYQQRQYTLQTLSFSGHTLTATPEAGVAYDTDAVVERIVVVGLGAAPQAITATAGGVQTPLSFAYDAAADRCVVRKPGVSVAQPWSVAFTM